MIFIIEHNILSPLRAPKWLKMAKYGILGHFKAPPGSTTIDSGDENHILYVVYPWNLLPKCFWGFKTDYDGRKLIFFHFSCIFLYILAQNPYKLGYSFPTLSGSQQILKKFMECYIMAGHQDSDLLSVLKTFCFFGPPYVDIIWRCELFTDFR